MDTPQEILQQTSSNTKTNPSHNYKKLKIILSFFVHIKTIWGTPEKKSIYKINIIYYFPTLIQKSIPYPYPLGYPERQKNTSQKNLQS